MATRAQLGFTLIEALIAAVIIGVLTAIGTAAYGSHIEKTRIRIATQEIGVLQGKIRLFYEDQRRFPTATEVSTLLGGNNKDPWGNAYIYLNILDGGPGVMSQVRKDKHLNPINTDFDLYSKGKNGVTAMQLDNRNSVDDIVRANDGAFIGLASDF